MLSDKEYRQIGVSAALGVAMGYLVALQFGLWVGLVAGAVTALITCDVKMTFDVTVSVIRATLLYVRGFMKNVVGSGERWRELFGGVLGIVPYLVKCANIALTILRRTVALGVGLFAVHVFLAFVFTPESLVEHIGADIIAVTVLAIGTLVNLALTEAFDQVLPRFIGFPLSSWLFRGSLKLWNSKFLRMDVPQGGDTSIEIYRLRSNGKLCSLSSLAKLSKSTFVWLWYPIQCFLALSLTALLGAVQFLVFFLVDLPLTALLFIATTKAISSATGAVIGITCQYILHPEFNSSDTVDILRFAVFMLFGAGAGLGIFCFRQLLVRLRTKALQA